MCNSSKGRVTYRFFPSAKQRLAKTHIEPDHYTVQFLSGHGNLNKKLTEFKIKDDSTCVCEEAEEDSYHVLYESKFHEEERLRLIQILNEQGLEWPTNEALLVRSEITYKGLVQFSREVLKKKEDLERRRIRNEEHRIERERED